jgi:hypothetical protein
MSLEIPVCPCCKKPPVHIAGEISSGFPAGYHRYECPPCQELAQESFGSDKPMGAWVSTFPWPTQEIALEEWSQIAEQVVDGGKSE